MRSPGIAVRQLSIHLVPREPLVVVHVARVMRQFEVRFRKVRSHHADEVVVHFLRFVWRKETTIRKHERGEVVVMWKVSN